MAPVVLAAPCCSEPNAGIGKWAAGAGGPRRETHLSTHLDVVGTRADEVEQRSCAEEVVEVVWP
jgi:hypothetical protein